MSPRSRVTMWAFVLVLLGPLPSTPAPPSDPDEDAFDLESYDLNGETEWDNLDINLYGDNYDYDDLDPEVEVATTAPATPPPPSQSSAEEELTPPPVASLPVTLDFRGPGLFGPQTGLGMPTCLLCVCLSGSVYCDDTGLDHIPPLPKDTAHFYGRFNHIRHVKNTDFLNLNQLRSIDLTGNQISDMDQDVFLSLPRLQVLLLADNHLRTVPELPTSMKRIDLRNNRVISGGLHPDAFKDMDGLHFLDLSDNDLDSVPAPLPLSLRVLHLQNNNIQTLHEDVFCRRDDRAFIRRHLEDIRLDGNPLNIHHFPQAYGCLPRLPVGGP